MINMDKILMIQLDGSWCFPTHSGSTINLRGGGGIEKKDNEGQERKTKNTQKRADVQKNCLASPRKKNQSEGPW